MYACFAGSLAVAGAVGACAASGKTTQFDTNTGGTDGGAQESATLNLTPDTGVDTGMISITDSTCSSGLMSITVSAATTTLTLPYSATPAPVTQTLTAQGTFKGGTTQDVTNCAVWNVSPSGATVTGGAFTTSTAGYYTVTVGAKTGMGSATTVSTSATVIVKLTGTVVATGVSTTTLDGTPSGTAPTIAYPLDGAMFPLHFGDLGWQVVPSSASFTTGRIAFSGEAIDLQVYAPCTPITGATVPNACSIAIPTALEADLAGASEAPTLTETVRVSDGTNVSESAPLSVRWSSNPLVGTIYYWSTPPSGGSGSSGASEVIRMNLETPGTPPEVFLTNNDVAGYADNLSGGWACIGCHAISPDGKKLGITIGGASVAANGDGNASFFALVNIANKEPTSARIDDGNGQYLQDGFCEMSTFSPSSDFMVQELQGQLFLRTADLSLTSTGPLFASVSEEMTEPYWTGNLLTFASWVVPAADVTQPPAYDHKDHNGNEIVNAQIWTASATDPGGGAMPTFGTPNLLVPRVSGATEYYPTISDDALFVAFDESSCSGPATPSADGYGASPCDSYDDPSAHLRLVPAAGGTPIDLDKASQRTNSWPTSSTWTDSWPRFAPSPPMGSKVAPSKFQGKNLYWLAFSSRLPYGATLAGSQTGATPPQIWFAAVVVDPGGQVTVDPSFAPIWLPQQNSATPEILIDGGSEPSSLGGSGKPTGNHVPQWVYTYVAYTPPDGGVLIPPPLPPK